MKRLLAALALSALLCAPAADAGLFGKSPEKSAAEAAAQRLPAVTIWVEATWGFRNQGAANSLSEAHKAFYAQAFGWSFQDYGPAYAAFSEGLDGGFTPDAMTPKPLPILYASDLEAMQAKVEAAGGAITHAIFAFLGGRRFHFRDPSGNELAVWSEK